jgi:hypothetical protein
MTFWDILLTFFEKFVISKSQVTNTFFNDKIWFVFTLVRCADSCCTEAGENEQDEVVVTDTALSQLLQSLLEQEERSLMVLMFAFEGPLWGVHVERGSCSCSRNVQSLVRTYVTHSLAILLSRQCKCQR